MAADAKLKQDPQYKALVAALGSHAKAKVAFERLRPSTPEVDPRVAQLMETGLFTQAEAEAAVAEQAAPVEAPAPQTSKQKAEALAESKGYTYARGRIYATTALAEAIVRVHKGGKPEIVQSSGVGRTKAVLVYKEESGDVALQNLTQGE